MGTTTEPADTDDEVTSPAEADDIVLTSSSRWAVTARVDAWLDARRGIAWALVSVLLGVVAVIIVVPAATGPGGLSPIDEYDYIDALDKADRGELSNTGDKTDAYARQVNTCRGLIGLVPGYADVCGLPQTDAMVPRDGFSAADIHPPTYFFATAWVSKLVRASGITDDLLIAGRLVGVLWLTLGMLAMIAAGRAWGAAWVMPTLTAVAVGASPLLVSASGYVTPDAMGLLVGSVVLLATTLWQRGRLPLVLLAVAAVAPAFVKVPFVLAPLFGAVLLFVAGLLGHTTWRRALTGAVVLVGGAGAGAVLWQLIRGALAVGVPTLHPAGPPPDLANFSRYFGYYLEVGPLASGLPVQASTLLAISVKPLLWLLLVAALGGILFRSRKNGIVAACWAGFAGMALGSMALSLIVLLASGGLLVGQARYSMGLVPLFALPLMCTRHTVATAGVALSVGGALTAHLLLW